MKIKKNGTVSKQGEGGGRPAKYKTEEELRVKVEIYITGSIERRRMMSKAGLLHVLDIDRTTYSDYKKKYPDTIRYVETLIEECWVHRLSENGATGAIFYLKNAFKEDYKDRSETDITSGGKKIIPILGGMSKKKA